MNFSVFGESMIVGRKQKKKIIVSMKKMLFIKYIRREIVLWIFLLYIYSLSS